MNFNHQAPLWSLLVLCAFSCLLCTPESQAREETYSNRNVQPTALDYSEPETLYRQAQVNKTAKCAPSSTRKKDVDGSIFKNGTMTLADSFPVARWNQSFLTGTATNSGITTATSQATLTSLSVSPWSGDTNTVFTFRVKFSDTSNHPPMYLEIVLDGQYYSMSEEPSQPQNYANGSFYTCSLQLNEGTFEFHVQGQDARGNEISSLSSNVIVTAVRQQSSQQTPDGNDYIAVGVVVFGIVLFICVLAAVVKNGNIALTNHSANRLASNNRGSNSISLTRYFQATNPGDLRNMNNRSSLSGQGINGILPRGSITTQSRATDSGTHWPATNPRIPRSAFIPAPSQGISALHDEARGFTTHHTETRTHASLESWDETFSAIHDHPRDYITPRTDPGILASLETWTEQELVMLERSCDDGMPVIDDKTVDSLEPYGNETGTLTPVPANILIEDDVSCESYTLSIGTVDYFAPKIRLAYVDATILNKDLTEQESLNYMVINDAGEGNVMDNNDRGICTLQLCSSRKELGTLVPLKWLIRQHLAKIVRMVTT